MQDDTIAVPPPPPAPSLQQLAERARAKPSAPVAHWTHTAVVLLTLCLIAIAGNGRAQEMTGSSSPLAEHAIAATSSRLARYVPTVVLEWMLLGSVIAGVYHRRTFFMRAFRANAKSNWQSLGMGVAVYAVGMMALVITALALHFTPLGTRTNPEVVLRLLPRTPAEFAMWAVVSLTAGVCEELIFRGYLMQQLGAWTARPWLAIVLTSLLFGSLHAYEGLGAVLPLAALAMVYGVVVERQRGDLRAVIVAHTLQDFLVALLALARPVIERAQSMHGSVG